MNRRKFASVPTKRKSQPYLFLSPSRSERDVGFYFALLLTEIVVVVIVGFFCLFCFF